MTTQILTFRPVARYGALAVTLLIGSAVVAGGLKLPKIKAPKLSQVVNVLSPSAAITSVAVGTVGGKPAEVARNLDAQVDKAGSAVGNAIADSAKAGLSYTVTPLKVNSSAVEAALGNKSWKEASTEFTNAYKKMAAKQGQAVKTSTGAVVEVSNIQFNTERDLAAVVGGKTATELVNGIQVPQRLAQALTLTAGEYAALVSQGKDPMMAFAAQLAVLLDQARDAHMHDAKPIPDSIKEMLALHYPQALLAGTKYAIGSIEISLPNGIRVFSPGNAVALNGLIVFPREPGQGLSSLMWWAHEVRHQEQYAELGGTLPFAWAYMRHSGSMEGDADRAAEIVMAKNSVTEQFVMRLASAETTLKARALTCANTKGIEPPHRRDSQAVCGLNLYVQPEATAATGVTRVAYFPDGKTNQYCGLNGSELTSWMQEQGWRCN
jgi:hypothetical protein